MMKVLGAPVHHTTTATSPESSVKTPPKYFYSITKTVNKTFDINTDSTQKGILFF